MFVAFHEAEKTISAERLHQTLHCAKAQLEIEIAVNCDSVFELSAAIICDQLRAFSFCKIDIRIVNQRCEIIVREAAPHSLEIGQIGLPVLDTGILRLKHTVQQTCRERLKASCGCL